MSAEQIAIMRAELTKPVRIDGEEYQWAKASGAVFDPWNVFPEVYGSYSSDFDDMAILVLENILANKWGAANGESLAHEMFRKMLCTAGLCTYGTSPRGCFPDYVDGRDIRPELECLLEKWREYRIAAWSDD
ncbi:hypothetical protein [Sphingomonas sp. TREG-RG-20F-R18-01]|uniref:hypothetical protein n=1 Tax=Sphingomonas sp. TREG-RG-20F-R18-01 TaxID=2914982 RepID=UPI001F59550E|nr:hypothetical protein [Sphingomonas sp. TREG-RG-20F-R18-01]